MSGSQDPNAADLGKVRGELARLCRRKELRLTAFTPDQPTHWAPMTVANPETGLAFTEAGAWEFVAQCLDRGEPIEEVALAMPKGKKGFVMIVPLVHGQSLYVKLQLGGSGKVFGRSFHISDR